ncbi:uncharacterized protein LOC128554368 [Mercenaria mercenaria]|uniref:uncharacterized protein LOC128554368 n=1 Tax=Mercenaria mercenaria TaxID=6596 RepID=UPI00234ED95A|nr:uncharacterized protein LOC128554368 [Mercenaria mercenaria]
MADFGGSDPPPDRNEGKGREEVKKNGSGGEGMSRTEVFLPPDIGASGSSFVQKSSQQVKDESSELTGSKSGDPGAKSIQNPNTGMKNKNQNRQMNREQMGHGGKKPESYIAAIAQNFTGDTTGQKIGIHKTEKPQKHQTAESNEPESHLNKEDTKAKAASNKQESFRPESEDGRGTRGSQTVRMGTKNNQEHLHREQRPEKIYSKQNREGIDGHEVKVSHVSVTGKQSDKGEHGSLLSGSFCVIRDEGE